MTLIDDHFGKSHSHSSIKTLRGRRCCGLCSSTVRNETKEPRSVDLQYVQIAVPMISCWIMKRSGKNVAASRSSYEIFKLLLERGANMNNICDYGLALLRKQYFRMFY